MVVRRSWWQKIKQHWLSILVIAIILVVTIDLIIVGYRVNWTGFNGNSKSGKTLWDWLNLLGVLAIPIVVGFGVTWFTVRHNHDIEIAREQHENDQCPQERWSSVTVSRASFHGRRREGGVRIKPRRTRSVRSAIAAKTIQESYIGPASLI